MAKKLYVGGISYGTSEDGLRSHFAAAGTVESASIIMDKMTNREETFKNYCRQRFWIQKKSCFTYENCLEKKKAIWIIFSNIIERNKI
jgi:hypothetical protein